MLTLATPIQTSAGLVSVRSVLVKFVNDASPAAVFVEWGPCDATGMATGTPSTITQLSAADEVVFLSTTGGFRARALAALQNNVGASLAGTVT